MSKKIKIALIQSKSLGIIQSNINLAIKNIKKAAKKKSKDNMSARTFFDKLLLSNRKPFKLQVSRKNTWKNI